MPVRDRERTNWVPYIGLGITITGIVFQSGIMTSRISNNTDRITRIEAIQATTTSTINDMNARSAKNEAKLDFLVEQAMAHSQKDK